MERDIRRDITRDIPKAREMIRDASRIFVLTGAGISAESGIPTFRGEGGLWQSYRPEELATPMAFRRDPKLVWEWYDWRRSLIANAEPNTGHLALVQLENEKEGFSLATQNVDGLHQRAGSRNVLELHGNIWKLQCTGCGNERIDYTVPLPELPPQCECGALERPGVVWFGEQLPKEVFQAALHDAAESDLTLVVGTSALVRPAAGLAHEALRAGRPVIEINPDETSLTSNATLSLHGPSGELLPQLIPPHKS